MVLCRFGHQGALEFSNVPVCKELWSVEFWESRVKTSLSGISVEYLGTVQLNKTPEGGVWDLQCHGLQGFVISTNGSLKESRE